MSFIEKGIAFVSPEMALKRAKSRLALQYITARYDAATSGPRGSAGQRVFSDANLAAQRRGVIANVGRDMERNNAYANRFIQVVCNAVVGDGIIPKVTGKSKSRARKVLLDVVKQHFDTTAIDADGRNNLYGLQQLAAKSIVRDGEVLIRRRRRLVSDGLPVPFQIQLLETDYLCTTADGILASGNVVQDGIEFDQIGRRVAYHLYAQHPGAAANWLRSSRVSVRRVDASEILHLYRVDRPGQQRGVSWFAPIATPLNDFADYLDAQLMRQKIAALFAAFRTSPELDRDPTQDELDGRFKNMAPGRIENLLPGESLTFANPPNVDGLSDMARISLRQVAVGGGITYEALTGDLSQVNFTSGRMGRMEMNANVSAWQWLMLIPQMMVPIGQWFVETYQMANGTMLPAGIGIGWVPPRRVMVDPSREIPAMVNEIRAGLASWSGSVRALGFDPEELIEEIVADAALFDQFKLTFDSDARRTSGAGQAQSVAGVLPADPNPDGVQNGQ